MEDVTGLNKTETETEDLAVYKQHWCWKYSNKWNWQITLLVLHVQIILGWLIEQNT